MSLADNINRLMLERELMKGKLLIDNFSCRVFTHNSAGC